MSTPPEPKYFASRDTAPGLSLIFHYHKIINTAVGFLPNHAGFPEAAGLVDTPGPLIELGNF